MASTPEDSGDEGRVSTPETFPDCWQCKQTLPAVLQTQETVLRFLRRQWGAGGRGDVNLEDGASARRSNRTGSKGTASSDVSGPAPGTQWREW
ncbi:hypothetical protein E4U26_001060 [Claviceps purpurea]|nr:hypothetical protein E4U37_004386 [Claviceps purpurea]KAG6228361.1 hypothetical protein E4U26_001060 [Claviceps purpurea]